MKIKLIVEDFYGGPFFIEVIQRLKKANLVNKSLIITKPKRSPADCNQKLDEILRIFDGTCDKIIIIFDADGPQKYGEKYERAQGHISNSMKTPVKIVVADYEIEEWICISKNIRWMHSKPSEVLKNKFGYNKRDLPKYATELDFDKLKKNCRSFKDFLKVLVP